MTQHVSFGYIGCIGCGPLNLVHGLTQDGRAWALEDRQQGLLLCLYLHGGWMTAKELEDDMWLDWHPGTAGSPLTALEKRGLVRSIMGAERRKLWQLVDA